MLTVLTVFPGSLSRPCVAGYPQRCSLRRRRPSMTSCASDLGLLARSDLGLLARGVCLGAGVLGLMTFYTSDIGPTSVAQQGRVGGR